MPKALKKDFRHIFLPRARIKVSYENVKLPPHKSKNQILNIPVNYYFCARQ